MIMIGKNRMSEKRFWLVIGACLLFSVLAYLLFSHFRALREKEQSFALENNISRIEHAFRHLRFAEGEAYFALSRDLFDNWQEIRKHFPTEAPEQFRRTSAWPAKSWEIEDKLSRVGEFYQEKDAEKASIYLEEAELAYLEIKSENGIPDFSRELYDFYLAAKKLSDAESKDDLEQLLPEFKLEFTKIKERFSQYRETGIMKELEQKVYTLDRQLAGPELWQTQEELPDFIKEIYLNN